MSRTYDVAILGGGVMGMFTARALAKRGAKVIIIEQYSLLNPFSASGGKSRSFRQDYLDPLYSTLAQQAGNEWDTFESELGLTALKRCGCLNLWDPKLNLAWVDSYAGRAANALAELKAEFSVREREELPSGFNCARGTLDVNGGVLQLGAIGSGLVSELRTLEIPYLENAAVDKIEVSNAGIEISVGLEKLSAAKLIIAAGRWAPEVLKKVTGIEVPELQLNLDRPLASMYCLPESPSPLLSELPVFACLDIGIYGHPMLVGATPGLKIGVFNPPNLGTEKIAPWSLELFLETFMPLYSKLKRVPVSDADLCCYDNTIDGDFIVGAISERVAVATGFCGTGYKFAPLIGRWMANFSAGLSEQAPERFSPWRFKKSKGDS